MPRKCNVPNCSSSSYRQPDMCFVGFPTKPDVREKWLQAIGRESWIPKPHHRICQLHFKDCDWLDKTSRAKRLKSSAVPSLFCSMDECFDGYEVSHFDGIVLISPSPHNFITHSPLCPISRPQDLHTTPVKLSPFDKPVSVLTNR
ncbi:hypothetical protein FOCC_FOCC000979 [Frankliniella occidentalis]|uniref:THAP domain-containing protein 1-like n=1 Tax=Frankliniella occidentalis TaxID=133901 RepID=A0A6J1TRM3_FRAOC|nr:THAP domain-containing protein 1-like [Frankliniella occidentalis]KAE8752186.1 hypothetical protein FOCC_FOCC000979 [Frankliniella occidentalis]